MKINDILGYSYVICWSVSMYPSLYMNWRLKNTQAVSLDSAILNISGYWYLLNALVLQFYCWNEGQNVQDNHIEKPLITRFDLWYCFHGLIINMILLTQLFAGRSLWKFQHESTLKRMRPIYFKISIITMLIWIILGSEFMINTSSVGKFDNIQIMSFCHKLSLLKICMSLIKYIPQMKHNYERKSMKGFSIQGSILDVMGSIFSLTQLALYLSEESEFNFIIFKSNFSKIGVGLVTLIFNLIYLLQWILYKS